MRKLLLLVAFLGSLGALAQDENDTIPSMTFEAVVLNAQSSQPLESVHVINLNKIVGTITDRQGKFTIEASVNDTLYFSYL